MKIILIGMPGCGKSTVGVLLAKRLGLSFIDTDLLIQEKSGKLLQEIIDESGDDRLLEIEQEVIREFKCSNAVIATGGSVVYSESGMKNLQKNAITVYIKIRFSAVIERISNLDTRGVVGAKNRSMSEIYTERAGLYEHYADITVDSDELSIEDTVSNIENAVKSQLKRSGTAYQPK